MSFLHNPESTPKKYSHKMPEMHTSDFNLHSDTQYNLCHSFMRITGDQLIRKQLQMMMETHKLMDNLNQKVNVMNKGINSSFSVIDRSFTASTIALENSVLQSNDDNASVQSKTRKIFCRKNSSSSNANKTTSINSFAQALDDIKENCSRSTYNQIATLLQDYKSLQVKNQTIQNNKQKPVPFTRTRGQNSIRATNDQFQQIILLTAKITKLQRENAGFRENIDELEDKLKMSKQNLLEMSNSLTRSIMSKKNTPNHSNSSPPAVNIQQIKNYLSQKQTILNSKQKELESISNKILVTLKQQFIDNGCQKCCQMMKKLKDSLLKYRNCLQDQYSQQEDLQKKYTKLLLQKSRQAIKIKEFKL